MNEEDEAFNEIERQAKQRKEAVRAAMRSVEEDDDIQDYKKPWVGLTDEERQEIWRSCEQQTPTTFVKAIEAKLKELNT